MGNLKLNSFPVIESVSKFFSYELSVEREKWKIDQKLIYRLFEAREFANVELVSIEEDEAIELKMRIQIVIKHLPQRFSSFV